MSTPTPKTALDRAVEADKKGEISKFLFFVANRRGVFHQNAEDVVGATYVRAFAAERRGEHWDPQVESASLYLGRVAVHVIGNFRRAQKRRPTDALDDQWDMANDELTAEEIIAAAQDAARQVKLVREKCAAETEGGYTLRILELMAKGTRGHKDLAAQLPCAIEVVRAAIKRLTRRARDVAEADWKA